MLSILRSPWQQKRQYKHLPAYFSFLLSTFCMAFSLPKYKHYKITISFQIFVIRNLAHHQPTLNLTRLSLPVMLPITIMKYFSLKYVKSHSRSTDHIHYWIYIHNFFYLFIFSNFKKLIAIFSLAVCFYGRYIILSSHSR